jgi:hypothetical protein
LQQFRQVWPNSWAAHRAAVSRDLIVLDLAPGIDKRPSNGTTLD